MPRFIMMLSRDLKRVPLDFDWPLNKVWEGYLITDPLGGLTEDQQDEVIDNFQPTEPPQGEGYQLWEKVSEGSPITPVFATERELAEWLAENDDSILAGTSVEDWLRIFAGQVQGTDVQTGELL